VPSLVAELQLGALDQQQSVSGLLRKALVVATKLKLKDFETWVAGELEGFPTDVEVPRHRVLRGELRMERLRTGWTPVRFQSAEERDLVSMIPIRESTSEIEALVAHVSGSDKNLTFPVPACVQSLLDDQHQVPVRALLFVSPTSLIGALDAVRNQLLRWSLQLEAQGIMGEGLTFTAQEVRAAQSIHVTNNFSHVQNAQVQTNSTGTLEMTVADQGQLRAVINLLDAANNEIAGLPKEDRERLDRDLESLKLQLESGTPKRSIVRASMASIRAILEQTAGSFAGAVLAKMSDLG